MKQNLGKVLFALKEIQMYVRAPADGQNSGHDMEGPSCQNHFSVLAYITQQQSGLFTSL